MEITANHLKAISICKDLALKGFGTTAEEAAWIVRDFLIQAEKEITAKQEENLDKEDK